MLNHSSFCIELDHGSTSLTTDCGTFSIIINVVSPKWCMMVAYFKYLRANLGGRLQTNRGGNIESISLNPIGRWRRSLASRAPADLKKSGPFEGYKY